MLFVRNYSHLLENSQEDHGSAFDALFLRSAIASAICTEDRGFPKESVTTSTDSYSLGLVAMVRVGHTLKYRWG